MNIYVGNLSKDVNEDDLKGLFSKYGSIKEVKIIKDSYSGESKGFGFLEMPNTTEAQKAVNELNAKELKGKQITVNEARPREDRGGGRRDDRSSGGGGRRSW